MEKGSIAIIGFGVSGISATHWSIKFGFRPVVYEKNTTFGGVWHSHTYPGCTLQTNRDSYTFSDMPMPKEYPIYPSGEQVYQYITAYILKYNLEKYVRYNSSVQSIKKIESKWHIYVDNKLYIYDYIILSTGFYKWTNNKFPHSILPHEIKKDKIDSIFHNKKVVVVGNGPSGCDIACLAVENNAYEVKILYRSPRWIVPRYLYGKSLHFLIWRIFLFIAKVFPTSLFRVSLIILYTLPFFHFNFPIEKATRSNLTLNDKIYGFSKNNKLMYINETVLNVESSNTLSTNSGKHKFDVLIDARGYSTGIPLLGYYNNIPKLYRHIIIPGIDNLGIIGFAATFNWIQVSDIQSRWLMNVFAGKIKIPSIIEQQISIGSDNSKDYHDLAYETYDYCDLLHYEITNNKRINIKRWFQTPYHNFYE
jgi:dimethylaniline monooxygenase (N-oxide forming)